MVMQIKMGKKGVAMTVVFMILVILGGIVLMLLSKDLFGTISEDVEKQKQVCRASIGKAFAGTIGCSPDVFPFEFQCKTDPPSPLIDSEDKEEVMQQLADKLYTCMWYIDRGKDLTKNEYCDIYLDRTYCFDCSVIEFGDKTRKLGSISITEFKDYLKNKPVPYFFDGSYYDYLFDANAYFSLDVRDNFDDFELGDQVRQISDIGRIDFDKDYIVTYGLYLEPAILPGGGGHFITIAPEESSLYQRLNERCERIV